MANDRIYIRCKSCREAILLYKHYPSIGYLFPDHDKLDKFMSTHITDCPPGATLSLNGDPRFELFTESDATEEAST